MLTLNRRECSLGTKFSGKVKEEDGGEQTRPFTFELEEVFLDKQELNALLGEPLAWDALYLERDTIEPLLSFIKAMEFKEPIENAFVKISFGQTGIGNGKREMEFTDARLSKIKLSLRSGGETALSCRVTCEPALDKSLAGLIEQFGSEAECEIHAQLPNDQQSLPLNGFGEGEQPEVKGRRGKGRGQTSAH